MAAKRVLQVVDPLDRWVRLSVIVEEYKEPKSSIHDLVRDLGLPVRWVGHVAYTNERAYQDAIASAPTEKPKKSDGVKKDRRGRDARNHLDGQETVPGVVEGQARQRPKLRLEEGGL